MDRARVGALRSPWYDARVGVGEVEIKGVAIRTFFEVMRDRTHERIEKALRDDLSPSAREALHDPVLAASWYPISVYRELHAAAQRATKGGTELSRQIGREGVARDFQGVYRLLAGALAPHWIVSWAPRVYARYFRGGAFEVPEARSGYARGELSGCHGFDKSLWLDMTGSIEAVLEACGAEHVRNRVVEGGGDGDHRLVIEFRWT